MTRYHFSRISGNKKTGPMPVTMTAADTCPDSCPFKGAGCYAEVGPIRIHWRKVPDTGIDTAQLCRLIRTIPGQMLWRHNQAGDLPGKGERINVTELQAIVRANRGRRGFTYTHKQVIGQPRNLAAIRAATAAGFTVNLSADNAADADSLAKTGLPAVVVMPTESGKVTRTPAGRKIVLCPNEFNSRIQCVNCGLCYLKDRPYIIGFKAKGKNKKLVNTIATGDTTT
jgi:hypothetical protein